MDPIEHSSWGATTIPHSKLAPLPDETGGAARPLSVGNKLAYACGDLSTNLMWGLMISFLMYYYTDIYVIPAASVAWLLLVPRVFDSFCDPLVGYFVDRTGGRYVTRIIGALAVPFGIAAFLCFLPLPLSPTGKLVWAWSSYLLLGAVYSIINTPYGVLSNMMATQAQERVSLNAFRLGGCQLGQLIVAGVTLPAIAYFGQGTAPDNQKAGITILVAIMAVASSALWLVTWRGCRVRRPLPPGDDGIRVLLGALATNRRWHLSNALTFLNFTVFCAQGGLAIHYTRLILGRPASQASFLLTGSTMAAFIGAICVPQLTRRLGVRRTFLLLMTCEAVCLTGTFLAGSHFWAVEAAVMVQYLAVGGVSPLCYSILSEAIDIRRRETGVAAAGLAFSINSLVSKVAAGIAGFAVATFLAWGHYQPGNATADATLTVWLKLGYVGLPAVAVLISFLLIFFSTRDDPAGDIMQKGLP